ncbi:MAG: gamma-glutamylcyclotransferase [Actinomycetota bacterium]|nr:gamma-glutamylcyclotransferase [Actinomycetota bacterium]
MTVRLFVYGTLAPGDEAWPVLEPWVVGEPLADAVAGWLYDTGRGYPAAVFLDEGRSLVHGTVVTLDPAAASVALDTLDRYEGPEYERISVRTETGVEAATYVWIAPLTGCRPVAGGRWRDR